MYSTLKTVGALAIFSVKYILVSWEWYSELKFVIMYLTISFDAAFIEHSEMVVPSSSKFTSEYNEPFTVFHLLRY